MTKTNQMLDNAISNFDDAIFTLITETELSGEEIYNLMIERVKDAHEYFLKPANKAQQILEKLQPTTDVQDKPKTTQGSIKLPLQQDNLNFKSYLWTATSNLTEDHLPANTSYEEVKYFLETEDQATERKNKQKTKSVQEEKSVSAEAYNIVVEAFAKELDIDVRQVAINSGLTEFDGLDLFYEDISKTWNKQIRSAIIKHCENHVFQLYGSSIKEMWDWDAGSSAKITVPAITEIDAKHMFKTLFDVMFICEHWINVYTCHLLKVELFIKHNIRPEAIQAVKSYINSLESKIIDNTFGGKVELLNQPAITEAMQNM